MRRVLGFTLLELLIGLTLLGLILALLFSGFRLASKTWDAAEARLERTMNEQMARALVRRLLTQMQPVRWAKSPNRAVAFLGEPERLVAIVPLGGALGGGLQAVEFSVASVGTAGSATVRLLFRHMAIAHDAEHFAADINQANQHVILDDLVAVRFAYFGVEQRGDPPSWQEVWSNPEELPRLVRLSLESADAGWSEVIVTPMLSGAACRWDSASKQCL
jgi:general secretion pathway protein J